MRQNRQNDMPERKWDFTQEDQNLFDFNCLLLMQAGASHLITLGSSYVKWGNSTYVQPHKTVRTAEY